MYGGWNKQFFMMTVICFLKSRIGINNHITVQSWVLIFKDPGSWYSREPRSGLHRDLQPSEHGQPSFIPCLWCYHWLIRRHHDIWCILLHFGLPSYSAKSKENSLWKVVHKFEGIWIFLHRRLLLERSFQPFHQSRDGSTHWNSWCCLCSLPRWL